jgi:hypothetical protein
MAGKGIGAGTSRASTARRTVSQRLEFAGMYDAHNLYFHYEVRSRSPLTNAIPDPQMIFKGGNLLDSRLKPWLTSEGPASRRQTPEP